MITFSKLGLHGRLGNQMFQYAAAKSASLNSDADFAIPIENHELIKNFNLSCKFYSLIQNQNIINKLTRYSETNFCYEQRFENISDNTDVFGYFQSERYFKNYSDDIKKDFAFNFDIVKSCMSKLHEIKMKDNSPIVSIHVRRTDYIALQHFHPPCTLEYYNDAMNQYPDCHFLIVSDDIEWCRQNILGKNISFSDSKTSIEDLCLMSLCEHNIIANSSFSWWGAWLNKNQNKRVIAPKKWFGQGYSQNDTKDLYCKDWIII